MHVRAFDSLSHPRHAQFVADGLFKAELNAFLKQELAEDGYSGVEVRVTPTRTEIIILATRTQNVLGEKGRRIRELTAVVQKRFGFPEGTVEVKDERGRFLAPGAQRSMRLLVFPPPLLPAVCGEGSSSRTLRHCTVRVAEIQADWWLGRAKVDSMAHTHHRHVATIHTPSPLT